MKERSTEYPSHLQIAQAALQVLADDGILDLPEVDYLLALAMRDGAVDPDERRVLRRIFDEIPLHAIAPEARERLREIRRDFGLGDGGE